MNLSNKSILECYLKGYRLSECGKILNTTFNIIYPKSKQNNYYTFSYRIGNRSIKIKCHRLQAYQKYGNKLFEEGIVVRHLDGNKLNNSCENILIGTHTDNMNDVPKEVRLEKALHATSFVRKYNKEEVIDFHSINKSYIETMAKFNISSKGTLHFILNK